MSGLALAEKLRLIDRVHSNVHLAVGCLGEAR